MSELEGFFSQQIYTHHIATVEPIFGNIVINDGLSQFRLRSRDNGQGQWRLYSMVHDIEEIKNYGDLMTR